MTSQDEIALFVDIDEFADESEVFFRRARAGEKIIVTANNKKIYEIPISDENVSSLKRELKWEKSRPNLSARGYAKLLDILEPLDWAPGQAASFLPIFFTLRAQIGTFISAPINEIYK